MYSRDGHSAFSSGGYGGDVAVWFGGGGAFFWHCPLLYNDVTELKTVEVPQLQCSDKVHDVPAVQFIDVGCPCEYAATQDVRRDVFCVIFEFL